MMRRLPPLQRHFQRARDLLARDDAQAAPDERVLHRRDDDVESVEPSGRHDHRVLEPGGLTRLAQSIAVGLGVDELQRIGRCQVRIVLFVSTVIEERGESFGGADPEVMGALGADVQAGFEVLVVDQLGAARTLDPEPLGDTAWFFGRLRGDRLPGLLEPRHSGAINAIQNAKVKMQSQKPFAFCILPFAGDMPQVLGT